MSYVIFRLPHWRPHPLKALFRWLATIKVGEYGPECPPWPMNVEPMSDEGIANIKARNNGHSVWGGDTVAALIARIEADHSL